MHNVPENPGPDLPRLRWRVCGFVWSGLALLIAAMEGAGLHRNGMLMQVVVIGSAFLLALLVAGWAAGIARKVMLLYATCLGTLVLIEAALRLYPELDPPTTEAHDSLFQFDDKLGWRLLPNAETVLEMRGLYRTSIKINSRGFRDREPDPIDPTPILAVIGDSFVSNFGVEASEVFTELLRKNLGGSFSIRNYGVNGYGQVQELLLLDEILASQRPAMVLIVVYIRNDFDDNLGIFDWNLGYRRPYCRLLDNQHIEIEPRVAKSSSAPESDPAARPALERAIVSTGVYRLFVRAFESAFPSRVAPHLRPPELRYCKQKLDERERKALDLTTALLIEMNRKCRMQDCRFGVVVAPSLWQVQHPQWEQLLRDYRALARDYDHNLPNRLLAAFCREQGFPCLDLLPELETAAAAGETLYYPREQHWNKRGQERVAMAIQTWLTDSRLGMRSEMPQAHTAAKPARPGARR
jgi:hypothetical protein